MDEKIADRYGLLSDIPAGEAGRGDNLRFERIAGVLAEAAIHTSNTITIGVLGEWGAGKTNLMRLTQKKVDGEPEAVAVWFNSWQYEKEEHLIVPLVATIKRKLESDLKTKKWSKSLKQGAERVRDALRAVAYGFSIKGKVGIPLAAEAEINLSPKDMIERYQDLLDDTVLGRSLYFDAFERFEQCTKEGEAPRIVVFVDDLDRCFPGKALELLEHIKLVLNQQGFTFVLGVNEKAIQAAINVKAERTKDFPEDYLDKIIQVTVRVPKRQSSEMHQYISDLMDQSNVFPEDLKEDLISLIAEASGRNPRSVVRHLNRIIIMHRIGIVEDKEYNILQLTIHVATDEIRYERFRKALDYWIRPSGNEKAVTIGEYLADGLERHDGDYQSWLQNLRGPEPGKREDELGDATEAFTNNEPLFNVLKSPPGLEWLKDAQLRLSLSEMTVSTVGERKKEEKIEGEQGRWLNKEEAIREIESRMVEIEGGEFTMGDGEDGHPVNLSGFAIGAMPVTQAQYKAIVGTNPSHFDEPDRPVECVSWEDAKTFCETLTEMTGQAYRLPTEAEWEYACRAGSSAAYCFGDDAEPLGDYAWYADNSDRETHSVGLKKPNQWRLYDMHGNVWEWCQDWLGDYPTEPQTDPQGPKVGSLRVLRGGFWGTGPQFCRSAYRGGSSPDDRNDYIGVRLLRSHP